MTDFFGEIANRMDDLGMTSDTDLEIVIGGSSVYEIDGAGTKWAPERGTVKYDKDAFVIIRRKRDVISSEPMENFSPAHGCQQST